MIRWMLVAAAALALGPRAARAQAPVDSAGIAAGVARFIAEELAGEMTAVSEVVIVSGATRFDSLVADKARRRVRLEQQAVATA